MPGQYILFGDSKSFIPPPWDTIDDRVRGGSSHSYLLSLSANGARFHGILDIGTLGGAGFASQFSPVPGSNGIAWDLGGYDGIEIAYSMGDGKVYTFIIKDDMGSGNRADGREMASVSWEVDFKAQENGGTVWKPWRDFKAFYRGKEKDDAGQLKTHEVRRIGLMMRSYFGTQQGEFTLDLKSISAMAAGDSEIIADS